jgi:hypothetical protein
MTQKREDSTEVPAITRLSRREFLKLLAGGAGAIALGTLGLGRIGTDDLSTTLQPRDVLLRNPAFLETAQNNHLVLYCQTPRQGFIAFELNSPAQWVWNQCVSLDARSKGAGATIADISSASDGLLDERTVVAFANEMRSRGLVFPDRPTSKVYFEYETLG